MKTEPLGVGYRRLTGWVPPRQEVSGAAATNQALLGDCDTRGAICRGPLEFTQGAQICRSLATQAGIPNVHFDTASALLAKFPQIRNRGFQHNQVFAVDPNSDIAKTFYQQLDEWCRAHGLAVVGLGMVNEFNHPFCFAPVTTDGLDGQLIQMDATDPAMGAFGGGKKTRAKPADPNHGMVFNNQIRALWLIPRDVAIEAGNAKYDVVQTMVGEGVNCAEFATGLIHHLHKLQTPEFAGFNSAYRAYVNPTGPKHERGFAAGLTMTARPPHIILQHTNPDWQKYACEELAGAYRPGDDAQLHTAPIDLTADYQEAEQ